ncbi:potassium transporter TrkG, partial [Thermoanaerobacterium thermosaccharolyticum]|uniref:potassium transporter TrkG n=1 Tax=Thermoanaerobacterium thermosaccharolyticum TaxID=1517 RepID=UPI0025463BB9
MTVRQKVQHILNSITPIQVLALGFATVILVGTFVLMLPISSRNNNTTDFTTALFTATSATCVTGLVVVDTGTYWSRFGQTVIMLLIQIGGLGFMSFATLLFMIIRLVHISKALILAIFKICFFLITLKIFYLIC